MFNRYFCYDGHHIPPNGKRLFSRLLNELCLEKLIYTPTQNEITLAMFFLPVKLSVHSTDPYLTCWVTVRPAWARLAWLGSSWTG